MRLSSSAVGKLKAARASDRNILPHKERGCKASEMRPRQKNAPPLHPRSGRLCAGKEEIEAGELRKPNP